MTKCAYICQKPLVYSIGIRLLHLRGFNILKKAIGKRKKVFEPACGFGRMHNYLYPDCSYSGIDLNERFIAFGRKRGLNIWKGDIFDKSNYVKNDIVILCDILHHLTMDDIKKLVSIAKKFSREKVIIMEPAFVGLASGKGFFSRTLAKIFSKIDFDGINNIENWFTKEDYHKLFKYLKSANNFSDMKIKLNGQYQVVEFVL